MSDLEDKIAAYANALDDDIDAVQFNQVRNGTLWSGYVGTIYGRMVSTEKGYAFQSRRDALENARHMRERCREIVRERRD